MGHGQLKGIPHFHCMTLDWHAARKTGKMSSVDILTIVREDETLILNGKIQASSALPLDCKASWLACVCASLASFVCVGTCYIYGIFFPAILEEFKAGKAETAIPGSFSVAFLTILCPLAAIFINRFGCRVVIPCGGFISALGLLGSFFAPNIYVLSFTYGFLVAWGSCLVYMAGFLMVPLYFDKHRSVATGMVSAGPGAGVLIMGPLAQFMIESLGWRTTMLVLAAINFVSGIPGYVITRKAKPKTTVEHNNTIATNKRNQDGCFKGKKICSLILSSINLSSLKNPMLAQIVAMNTTLYLGHYMPLVHLINYAEDIGISSHASSWMYPITGMISTVCRILTGKVGDTGRVSFYTMFQCGLLLMAMTQFLMPLASNVGYLYGYAVMQGICEAMYFTSAYCLAMSVDPRQGLGWLMFFASIPMFLGAPVAGFIADYSRSYAPVFNTSGCFLVLASLLPFLRHCITRPVVSNRTQVYYVEQLNTLPLVERETVL